jgi:serine/threonine protein phosphatase PrpC
MSEKRPFTLRIGAGAHRGLVREENQDRISRIVSPFGEVFVVADGMGGHEGGATAAQMLIDGLGEHLRALPPETPPEEALRQAMAQTNTEIHRKGHGSNPRLSHMGATCVLALVQGDRAWIGHAGDSRAYLWREGRLSRLTRDHTLVQRMVDNQILNEEEARHHPDSNVVTRSVGQKPETELEISSPLELLDGDRLLLCSDGLSGYVEDAAIARALGEQPEAQAATDALIRLALEAGGRDNVSVQIVAVQAQEARAAAPVTAATAAQGVSGILLWLPLLLVLVLAGFMLPWRSWVAPAPPAAPEVRAPAPPSQDVPQVPEPSEPEPDATDPYGAPSAPETGPNPGEVPLGTDFAAPEEPRPSGPVTGGRQ